MKMFKITECDVIRQKGNGDWTGCPFCLNAEGAEPRYCRFFSSLSVRYISDGFKCPLEVEINVSSIANGGSYPEDEPRFCNPGAALKAERDKP